MNTFTNFLVSLIVATLIAAIAILSIQNVYLEDDSLLSLRFLTFQTIELPVGVVLAFSVGIGMVGGAIAPLFCPRSRRLQEPLSLEEDLEDEEEEDPLENWPPDSLSNR